MTSDACPRSMDPPLSRDNEGAQLGFSVPSCSEDPLNSMGGAQAAFSQPSRSRPGALQGHGRFSSQRPQFGRLRAWHALQGYPCGYEVRAWGRGGGGGWPSRTSSSSRTVRER